MQLFSQRDPRWAGKELGWGPPGSTIGGVGCDETCDSMIAVDSGLNYNPPALDDYYTANRIFSYSSGGDFDLLTDDALARAFPGRFAVQTVWGYDAARIAAAVASPDVYVKLWIRTASVPTHFVISYGGNTIADPWTGAIGSLSGYGGPAAVGKMIFVRKLPDPAIAAAAAAAALAAAAAAQAKADAAAAAAKAEADAAAQAAYDAAALADAEAKAIAQAAADAIAEAARKAAADEAANKVPVPSNPPPLNATQAFLNLLQLVLITIGRFLSREKR